MLSIGQPLTLGVLHRGKGPIIAIEAQSDTVIEAELELRKIPVQVLLPAVTP